MGGTDLPRQAVDLGLAAGGPQGDRGIGGCRDVGNAVIRETDPCVMPVRQVGTALVRTMRDVVETGNLHQLNEEEEREKFTRPYRVRASRSHRRDGGLMAGRVGRLESICRVAWASGARW
jgi:hypothetical protein